jgi:RNA polymerase sigma factor (sigma-70 family)
MDLAIDESHAEDEPDPVTTLNIIGGLIADLPPRQRAVVQCRCLDGMSITETAAALNCAPGTVKATLSCARRALRKRLNDAQSATKPLT